jgi:hypothetical protein
MPWNVCQQYEVLALPTAISKYVSAFLESSDPRMIRYFIKGLIGVLDVIEEKRENAMLDDLIEKLEFEHED